MADDEIGGKYVGSVISDLGREVVANIACVKVVRDLGVLKLVSLT